MSPMIRTKIEHPQAEAGSRALRNRLGVIAIFWLVVLTVEPAVAQTEWEICFQNIAAGTTANFAVTLSGRTDKTSKSLAAGERQCVDWGVPDGHGCDKTRAYVVTAEVQGAADRLTARGVLCGDVVVLSDDSDGDGLSVQVEGADRYRRDDSCPAGDGDKTLLLAHGKADSEANWQSFADAAGARGWTVYRTSVPPEGSIVARATVLAEYLNQAAADAPDYSIKAVGHSMGGLDLRYIVGQANLGNEPFLSAAKKIRKVYTVATPHYGNIFAGLGSFVSDAIHDLSRSSMAEFNAAYPYADLRVKSGRRVPFLALTFKCGDSDTDGVVNLNNQVWARAPYYPAEPWEAYHKAPQGGDCDADPTATNGGATCTRELCRVSPVLNFILDDPVCERTSSAVAALPSPADDPFRPRIARE